MTFRYNDCTMKKIFTLVKTNWKTITLAVWMSFITYVILYDSAYPPAHYKISKELRSMHTDINTSIYGETNEVIMHINRFDNQINSKMDDIESEINSIKSDLNKIKIK